VSDVVLFGGFAVVVTVLLAIDLFVVHRDTHEVSIREAGTWSAIWIGVAILFGLFVPALHAEAGQNARAEYFVGYVIEKSLSVDNVFLFVLIFSALSVPKALQHRVLFFGVLGAIVMRTILIFTGAALIERFEWILLVFGAFLLFAAYKTWRQREEHPDIADSKLLQRIRRIVPTTSDYRGEKFFVREDGKRFATPLFVVLVLVEFTDLIFAMDSIPAIFAITRDPFIVLTSNIFAILGLRALYFLLAGAADRLHYLKAGLAVILGYVGLKLLTENVEGIWHPSPLQSLAIISAVLVVVIIASLRRPRHDGDEPPSGVAFPGAYERSDA
jgi:tellurite resistance protein TerC